MSHLGPIAGSEVCTRYHIDIADWKAMDPSDRSMFRMAFAAEVWHLTEEPHGSNSGPEVNRILHVAGVDPGNPWCAAIRTTYLIDSGVPRHNLPDNPASVHGWGEWAKKKGRIIKHPVRGCNGLIYHTATTGHLVVVTSVGSRTVSTLEGNTTLDGSREGYGVFRRERPISQFAMFVDCNGLG